MLRGRSAVTAESFWRRDPAAAFRGLANGFFPSDTIFSLSFLKSADEMKTSPRTSSSAGWFSPANFCGIEAIVRTLWVTSSPVVPSPRVAARTNTPLRYSRLTARPSIFSSVSHCGAAPVRRRVFSSAFVSHARSSSREKTSSREYMRTRWVTGEKASLTSPPTSWVGESLAINAGYCASICSSLR